MSSPVFFSMTGAQRKALGAVALQPRRAATLPRTVRESLTRAGLLTRDSSPALTPAGKCAAGLALLLVKASPIPALFASPDRGSK